MSPQAPIAASAEPSSLRALSAGVFLTSMAVLILEIALTRVFSFTIWYHFAYVAIAIALLGYGASGALLAAFPRLGGGVLGRRVACFATAAAFAILAATIVFARVPFSAFALARGVRVQLPYALVFFGAATAPFVLAGLVIATTLSALAEHADRIYGVDLAGAGVGCLAVVPLVAFFGAPGAIVVSAVLLGLAATCFASGTGRRASVATSVATIVVAVAGAALVAALDFRPAPEKSLAPFLADGAGIEMYASEWSPIFRTDVFGWKDDEVSRAGGYAGWGLNPAWRAEAARRGPKARFITHDGDAGAPLYAFHGDRAELELFDHHVLGAPYALLARPQVLVIGVGGGADLLNAIRHEAAHVTGLELDPVTVRQVAVEQAEFAGRVLARPDVRVIVGEGRSTLRRSSETYDLIQLTEVDTFAALTTGAYVTSESYLYTTEAVGDFLDHLAPAGLLSVAVVDLGGPAGGYPRHTMRQLALVVAALRARGIDDAEGRVAVVASTEDWPVVEVLVKNGVFTDDEVARLRRFAEREGFRVWALPSERFATPHSELLRTPPAARDRFLADQELVVTAVGDDRPFFFNFYRWRSLGAKLGELDPGHTLATAQVVLASIVLASVAASAAMIVLPLAVFRRAGLAAPGASRFVAFFVAIGVGFSFVEISVVQRFVLFLGYPTYSLTVVLCALLGASGIGSALSGRLGPAPERRLVPLLAVLAALVAAFVAGTPWLVTRFLGSPLAFRVVLTVATLVPLGLVLGMLFPTGIALARRASPELVPWAWGVNASAAVVGSVLAVVLAMALGFRAVTCLALVAYLAGGLALRGVPSR